MLKLGFQGVAGSPTGYDPIISILAFYSCQCLAKMMQVMMNKWCNF